MHPKLFSVCLAHFYEVVERLTWCVFRWAGEIKLFSPFFPLSLSMTEWCALAWNYKMSFKDLWSRQQNWSQWSFFKRMLFFSYSETEKLVGVFFSPMKYYSATERLCLPNGKSFMLIQDKTSKVYDFPTVSLWCSHIIFALPYWGIKHIGRWWCVLVSGLLLDVSSQKLAAAQALCPLTLLGVQPHICLGCSCGNWFQNTLLHLSSPP